MTEIKYAGIFAAGEGKRLKNLFPSLEKPMVPVCGKPLIYWAVRVLLRAGFEHITILFNSRGGDAKNYLKKTFPDVGFVFIMKDTKTSYESFRLVSQLTAQKADKFLLSTVDALYKPEDLDRFLSFAGKEKYDALLGITAKIEDEKPLWADISPDNKITAMGQWAKDKKYATSGIYVFTETLANEMPEPARYGALRDYLTETVLNGKKIRAFEMANAVDVDDEKDIKLAEIFVAKNLREEVNK